MKTIIIFLSIVLCWLIGGCSPFSNQSKLNFNTPRPSTQSSVKPDKEVNEVDEVNEGSQVIPQGTKVDNDLDLSNIPVSEASRKINDWAKDKLEESRVLLYNETEIPITLKELGFEVDVEKTLENAQQRQNQPQSQSQNQNNVNVIPSVLKANPELAAKVLKEKFKKFNQPAKDATFKIQNDKVVITPAQKGRKVEVDQLINNLQNSSLSEVPSKIKAPLVEVPAKVTTESIESLSGSVLGEFSTKFAVGETNRSANLTAAAKALDGKVINPGAVFSFNNAVGPREPQTGYKEAYVIINGEYVKGTGGGVCQVSSTLYNAVLLSNFEVVERKHHDVAVSYIPAGQDATVNYPNIDFKFRNNTGSLAYMRTEVKPGVLTIKLYGKKTGKTVRLERQIVKVRNYKTIRRYDSKLPRGRVKVDQIGTKGIVVNVWKVIQDEKGHVTKQFLGRDSYEPANRILLIGT
ncbi:vancomycin B-type resistance protein VanW [Desulfosporosinus acididurans]|uniref:Vancomycin B-type resistance protein VanW n=1 Tax=Desulfosporosinus acididurans TaxID=476652 RepID=A0A0J1FSI1_9FIRM|nr:VanW family protein [Desulfosporosinus acididurans]KLU66440.1 vancomycin B-type resistance protein VanW [Desulfosporosinus acididurans]